jgi:hypothetical protein
MKTSEALRAALNLLKTKGWTQEAYARTALGHATGQSIRGRAMYSTTLSSRPRPGGARNMLEAIVVYLIVCCFAFIVWTLKGL